MQCWCALIRAKQLSVAVTSLVPRLRMHSFWYCRPFVEHSDFGMVLIFLSYCLHYTSSSLFWVWALRCVGSSASKSLSECRLSSNNHYWFAEIFFVFPLKSDSMATVSVRCGAHTTNPTCGEFCIVLQITSVLTARYAITFILFLIPFLRFSFYYLEFQLHFLFLKVRFIFTTVWPFCWFAFLVIVDFLCWIMLFCSSRFFEN